MSSPRASGETDEIVVKVHGVSKNRTVFFSVAAVDEAGNEGDTSNLVSLSPAQETAVPRPAQVTLTQKTYLALALPAALAFFFFIVLAFIVMIVKARKVGSIKVDTLKATSVSSISDVDLSKMNYMYEGEYRKRYPENPENWNDENYVY